MICNESKPYIFVSYSHRNSEQVVDIINHLVKEGYNVWYDEGIDPGTEWDENIARHIKECAYFLAFVSNPYVESKNCKDELNYSRSLDKNQLLVYLEDATLPDGMMMRMNRIQSIHWGRYSADKLDDAYAKLYSASGIEVTKIAEEAPEDWKEYQVPEHRKSSAPKAEESPALAEKKKNKTGLYIGLGVAGAAVVVGGIVGGIGIKKSSDAKALNQLITDGIDYLHGTNGKEYDLNAALELFMQADEKGSEDGTLLTGYTLASAMGGTFDRNQKEALEYLEKCEEDNAYACILIGNIYSAGGDVEEDDNKAEDYWEKGLSLVDGDLMASTSELSYQAEACNVIGSMYMNEVYEGFDYEIAKEYYDISAANGSPIGMNNLGYLYDCGYGINENDEKAFEWYQKAVDIGYVRAIYNMGLCYYNGTSVEQDYDEAKKYFKQAAELGNDGAMNKIGNMYYYGYGVDQDDDKAMEWYEKAAELNNADAMNSIGIMYYYGYGVDKDVATAISWYEKAAGTGSATAMSNLGNKYYSGDGVEQDYDKAMEWFQLAADKGNSSGMVGMGKLYYYGKGVEQDYAKAMEWFQQAADKNNGEAMELLGGFYYWGYGVEPDYEKALEWYKKGAELNRGFCFHMIGAMYYFGNGINQDYAKAAEYFEAAIDHGNTTAYQRLGDMYYYGYYYDVDKTKAIDCYEAYLDAGNTGLDATQLTHIADAYNYDNCGDRERNHERAFDFYSQAADLGSGYGLFTVGLLYYYGNGVDQDESKAVQCFMDSLDLYKEEGKNAASPEAWLGYCYADGKGVAVDNEQAYYWFEKAANDDSKWACYVLGYWYENGEHGVTKNTATAISWYEKCVDLGGYQDADERLAALQ